MIFLHTDRLMFRAHEAADEAPFVEMHTDPEVRRYVGGRAWPMDEAVVRFRRTFLGRPRRLYGLWAMILARNSTYIGMCGLRGSRSSAHLGFYLARPYWGMGLATEAAGAFVDLGVRHLHLPRILADAEIGNRASRRILERFGFTSSRDETLESGRIIRHYELRTK